MADFTEKQLSDIALAAAKEAVRQQEERMFALLGVNVADFDDLKRLREDIEFAHRLRVNAGQAGGKAMLTLVSAITMAGIIGLWEAIKALLHAP